MDILLQGFEILARWDVMVALLVGSVGGVLIGAIPGVGPAVAIAILLPATFSMDPIVGLTVLLGIYGSSMYGGAIPAILINTPGTAVNALTTYDGYPMTTRGEAKRALSLAYSASFFGGVFSVVCLILFAPVLAKVAPMFGSREIFLAALLGLILVVIAHRGQSLIAAALACFGIFLHTVGLEPVKYSKRFTFDQSWLSSGVDLIVVVLGLFAISQAIFLLRGEDEKIRMTSLRGGLFQGMRELSRHPRVATVSASLGVLMGMIPGVGEFTAQFLSYTYAQRTSERPDDFGHGASEGLIAAETSNNAVPAAAMVPLLALGIPGEALTAMMLSVFYVHNVVPGPQLFQNQMDFVTALYLALLILNILVMGFLVFSTSPLVQRLRLPGSVLLAAFAVLTVGVLIKDNNLVEVLSGFSALRFVAFAIFGVAGFAVLFWVAQNLINVVKIPNRFLGAAILTLSFVGVYSLRNSFTDCLIAACFGVFGFVLKRLSLPAVPIVLGMVLGGIMEVKLRAGMARVKTPFDFIDRPVAMILFIMILGVLLIHFRYVLRERKSLKEAKWQAKHASTNFGAQMSRRRSYLSTERGKKLRAKRSKYSPRSTAKGSRR